ncbi:MAG: ATP-binding protein, partial [Gammaproteobacteria bacterium]|nr:ATP-binding protein [Gammaproteobacteria bacterium]
MSATVPLVHKRRLQSHFGFTGLPFRKGLKAAQMFDSTSQRELGQALHLWLEIGGMALVTGPPGVGKSITLRRFANSLENTRFHIVRFAQAPLTPVGFLRSLNRQLGLPLRRHTADLFDQARTYLN